MKMKTRQILMTAVLAVNILFFFQSWFGGKRGVQEISGTIVLFHPVTVSALAFTAIGIWMKQSGRLQTILLTAGPSALLGMELFFFLTWYAGSVPLQFSLAKSFSFAFASFYAGLALAVLLLCMNLFFVKQISKAENQEKKLFR